jgi:hypothetical protein
MMQEGGGAVLAALLILTAWFFFSGVRAMIWHTWDITEAMAKISASPTIGADGGRVGAKAEVNSGEPPDPDAVDQGKRRPLASRFPACCNAFPCAPLRSAYAPHTLRAPSACAPPRRFRHSLPRFHWDCV